MPDTGNAHALKLARRAVDGHLMRHFRLWLLAIGALSLAAEAAAAAAVFWRGGVPARRLRRL